MRNLLRRFMADESAATAIEYGLIAALIALVIISGLNRVGTSVNSKLSSIATSLR